MKTHINTKHKFNHTTKNKHSCKTYNLTTYRKHTTHHYKRNTIEKQTFETPNK